MSDVPSISTTATAAADEAGNDNDNVVKDGATAETDVGGGSAKSKAMMEYFCKRYKSGEASADTQASVVCDASASTTDVVDCKSLLGEKLSLDIHKDYGYYHTVSSSDARVLRAALAKERVPIFRRSDSRARRSTAGVGMRFANARERITEGEITQADGQSLSPARADSKSFRDIFLRRRNRSDQRSDPNPDLAAEGKPKSGRMRIRNFLVSFRRPRSVSVSYAPVDTSSSGPAAGATSASTSGSVQTFGKKKKFKVTPATLLPGLKRPEPAAPRVGPEDFVEMFCRSRTTSDPRADALLKARMTASLHKVKYSQCYLFRSVYTQ